MASYFTVSPEDAIWRRVEIEPTDHNRLRYANEPAWVAHSDGTRLVTRLAEKTARGEIPFDLARHINAIQGALKSGENLSELIAAEGMGTR